MALTSFRETDKTFLIKILLFLKSNFLAFKNKKAVIVLTNIKRTANTFDKLIENEFAKSSITRDNSLSCR